jgi:hypothetical protein
MTHPVYAPPWWLANGLSMTLYTSLRGSRDYKKFVLDPEPTYQEKSLLGLLECRFLGLLPYLKIPEAPLLAPMGLQAIWITSGF